MEDIFLQRRRGRKRYPRSSEMSSRMSKCLASTFSTLIDKQANNFSLTNSTRTHCHQPYGLFLPSAVANECQLIQYSLMNTENSVIYIQMGGHRVKTIKGLNFDPCETPVGRPEGIDGIRLWTVGSGWMLNRTCDWRITPASLNS